ncbi:CopM family metallochaperone [Skermanella pratensis]|uniref:CopM family metallochaperone n=1 Tax=Skermanella pratensis TaxID=2233999 RepID=UPI001300DF25|nr:DUF305 domain-containing protein [Skermanella pratensis]
MKVFADLRWPGAAAALLVIVTAAPGLGQQDHGGHGGHGAPASSAPVEGSSAVADAFRRSSARMHQDMEVGLTGDADQDFARSMIPHHQGAIDMARIQLEHGKDPEMRRLAEEVVAAQEREIERLRDWLARNPRKP